MSATTKTVYQPPITTGADAQRQLARMKARAVARYNLVAVPGRPEELARPGTDKAVSFGYGCKTIRVRPMTGRVWDDDNTVDYQIAEGWSATLYGQLDRHFDFEI